MTVKIKKTKIRLGNKETSANGNQNIILVGNPNVGKSVLFSELTGKYAVVSNYPGTTVELSNGIINIAGSERKLLDTPGINSLFPESEDEVITLKILLENQDAPILQVLNSVNLKRGLFITAQLALLEVPTALALNVSDEAASKGIEIDEKILSRLTGINTIKTVATRKEGITKLKKAVAHPSEIIRKPKFDKPVEEAVAEIITMFPSNMKGTKFISLLCLMNENFEDLLSKASIVPEMDLTSFRKKIKTLRNRLSKIYNGNLTFEINRQIHREADFLFNEVTTIYAPIENEFTARLSRMMMHPAWGMLIAIIILLLTYIVVGRIGAGIFVDFFNDEIFGKILTPGVNNFVEKAIPSQFFKELLTGQYGLWTIGITYSIAIVLPIVFFFFLIFGILEDSGYLPRLAVILNKPFRFMGLSGKAVLPMVLGLGCATMATLTARILETKKERVIVTLLLALAIPCSAQLGVIIGLLGVLPGGALFWWLGSILLVLLLVGKIAYYVLPGESTKFIQEIPPLRIPQAKNLFVKTFARMRWYLKEAVPLFILGALILYVLNTTGIIKAIEEASTPILSGLMGLPKETTSAFILGFIRRDYAATGLLELFRKGMLTPVQGLVGMTAITLFIPCAANMFVMIKERGWKTAIVMILFIIPFSVLFSSFLNLVLKTFGVTFM